MWRPPMPIQATRPFTDRNMSLITTTIIIGPIRCIRPIQTRIVAGPLAMAIDEYCGRFNSV